MLFLAKYSELYIFRSPGETMGLQNGLMSPTQSEDSTQVNVDNMDIDMNMTIEANMLDGEHENEAGEGEGEEIKSPIESILSSSQDSDSYTENIPKNSINRYNVQDSNIKETQQKPHQSDQLRQIHDYNGKSSTLNGINGDNESSNQSFKMDINKLDSDVSLVIEKCKHIDWEQLHHGEEIHEMIKSTILRLNLKNNLTKNELVRQKDDYDIERNLLLNQLNQLNKKLRITENENDEVNKRNLKYIKYIKTLKNEKLKPLILENKKLVEHIGKLEEEYGINKGARLQQQQIKAGVFASPQFDSNISNAMNHTDLLSTPNQSNGTNNTLFPSGKPEDYHMLNTLGRLATEYLNNDF